MSVSTITIVPVSDAEPATLSAAAARHGRRVESLDGLRAVAILLILAYHVTVPGFRMGWIGVEMFFVLSAFLITSILAEEHSRDGHVNLYHFWIRRLLRVAPIYTLYISAITIAVLLTPPAMRHTRGGWSWQWYLISLWGYFINHVPREGIWPHQFLTVQLWTIAIVMQFYLIWPLLLLAILKMAGRWAAPVVTFLAALAILYPIFRGSTRSMAVFFRGSALLLGAAGALWTRWINSEPDAADPKIKATAIAAIGLLAFAVCTLALKRNAVSDEWLHLWLAPVFSAFTTVAIMKMWRGEPWWMARLLKRQPLRYLGKISYGLYLYHVPPLYLLSRCLPQFKSLPHQLLAFSLGVALFAATTLGIAAISYQFIERPFLGLKKRFRS